MIVLTLLVFPVEHDQESGQHTAQMGKVGHVVGYAVSQSERKLQYHISYYQPLGLDGEREGYDKELVVRERHSVTEQYSVNGTRCTHGKYLVKELCHGDCKTVSYRHNLIMRVNEGPVYELAEFLCEACANSADEIEYEELF